MIQLLYAGIWPLKSEVAGCCGRANSPSMVAFTASVYQIEHASVEQKDGYGIGVGRRHISVSVGGEEAENRVPAKGLVVEGSHGD